MVTRSCRILLLLICVRVFSVEAAFAQDGAVITRENVRQLKEVLFIDFAAVAPEVAAAGNGWFVLSPDGRQVLSMTADGRIVLIDGLRGELITTIDVPGVDGLPATLIDAHYSDDGTRIAMLHVSGSRYIVSVFDIDTEQLSSMVFPNSQDTPISIWIDSSGQWVLLETLASGIHPEALNYTLRMPISMQNGDVEIIPGGPNNDPQAVLRIGRMSPPYAVTVKSDGEVTLWNRDTGLPIARALIDGMPAAGQINALAAMTFAWRDAQDNTLHMLDFRTGEDRMIAPMGQGYAQALFVSNQSDLVLAVDIDFEPIVVAWDTASGERLDLGTYSNCDRSPDAIRMSRDGTTLAIGCGNGIRIWRTVAG